MKLLEKLLKILNSKESSLMDYVLLIMMFLFVFYGFFISSEDPDFWDWLNLYLIPIGIITTIFKPSVYIGKMFSSKAKKRK